MFCAIRNFAAIVSLVVLSWPAAAQYPSKSVRIILPFPAGSATDIVTRIIAQQLSINFSQPVVIDYKPGADGAIAAAEVVRSAPDGYTLFMTTHSPMAAVPAMRKVRPYDPVSDFTPITFVGKYNLFALVHPGVPAKTLSEFFEYARKNPGKLNYGTGNTTGIGMTAELMHVGGIQMMHIPYKGEPAALIDLVAGRIQFLIATQTTSLPFVKDGKLVALVTTSRVRSRAVPEVPTITEAGYKQLSVLSWAGLFAPAKTPVAVVERINRDVTAVLNRPDIREKLEGQFFDASGSSPAQLASYLSEQIDVWSKLASELGLRE